MGSVAQVSGPQGRIPLSRLTSTTRTVTTSMTTLRRRPALFSSSSPSTRRSRPTTRTKTTDVAVAALPSKWPPRRSGRSPSPRRNNNNGENEEEGGETQPPPPPPRSLWRWRARARAHRHAAQRSRLGLPCVDWSRQNLQVLFVDDTGTTRARFAALLCERVGDWSGLGRALAASAAGLYSLEEEEENDDDDETSSSSFSASSSTSVALMSQASRLKLRPLRALASPRAPPFELSDLDAFDLVLCVDAATEKKLFDRYLGGRASPDAEFYAPRIATLGSFAACRSPGRSLSAKGSDTLDDELAAMAFVSGEERRKERKKRNEGKNDDDDDGSYDDDENNGDVPRVPSLLGPTSSEDFDRMVKSTVRGIAGLVQYLADGLPMDEGGR